MILDIHLLPDTPSTEVLAFAKDSEAAGFDCIWVPEVRRDPFILMGLIAANTTKIRIGSCIALAFPRSPTITAQSAWDLQRHSKGRFILGLGTQVKGHIERRFATKWESPGPRMKEYIQAVRAIWECWQTGKPLNFRGRFYDLTLMPPMWSPGPLDDPNIPIFTAALNKYMCRLAGEVCDGVHIHPLHTVKYIEEAVLPSIEAGLKRSGRKRGDIQLSTLKLAAIGRDESEIQAAKEVVRTIVAFYASTRTYKPVLELHGWGDVVDRLHEKSVRGEWMSMPNEIDDEMLKEFAVEGSLLDAAREIKKLYRGILDRISFYPTPFLPGPRDPVWGEVKRILA